MKSPVQIASILLLLATFSLAAEPLVVHEWGTFTSLQDEGGHTIGGLNTDDEPVPAFVHTVASNLLIRQTELPNVYFVKGYPALHPDVTMRLETPVMYFYPSTDQPVQLTVKATFRGGWLTEYYPVAEVKTPGLNLPSGQISKGGLNSDTQGSLTWTDLVIGGDGVGPDTAEEVWLAPRRVQAATVTMFQGEGGGEGELPSESESEKYLFYRGLGHVEAPLRVTSAAGRLEIHTGAIEPAFEGLAIANAWLVDIRADGCAFRFVDGLVFGDPAQAMPSDFEEEDFSAGNLAALKRQMHSALVADGLFADEAAAMLETWEAAYFHSEGRRLFYTVPQQWTDHFLPLEFSESVQIDRVMIGRIELVTPRQRELLTQIATSPVKLFPSAEVRKAKQAWDGEAAARLADLDVDLPSSFLAYRQLGRLRDALVLHELAERPTPQLQEFVSSYRLGVSLRSPNLTIVDDVGPIPTWSDLRGD